MPPPAESRQLRGLLVELTELRESCVALEHEFASSIAAACPQSRRSVRNLLHYVALRKVDLRDLQSRLAALGLSSLGRSESSALEGLNALIAILESVVGGCSLEVARNTDAEQKTGSAILAEHADHLLGIAPTDRAVRIMVTMPSEAATSYPLVKDLVGAGMDVMRVNCAHDSEGEWECMIAHMRRANLELSKHCKAQMDLAGPKLRTGPIRRGCHVVRWRVARDERGDVIAPARIAITGSHGAQSPVSADVIIPVTEALLHALRKGDTLKLKDSRGKKRELLVIEKADHHCVCTCGKGAYVLGRSEVSLVRDGTKIAVGHVGALPFIEKPIRLHTGDLLVLTREEDPPAALVHGDLPHISCTLPEAFATAQASQPIFFDDGLIEGRIREVGADRMLVEIVRAAANGAKLGSGKGINLPETNLGISAMTEKDRLDLDFVAKHADIVGLSFARRPEDVLELQRELAARGGTELGIVLKIESREGFEQLPLTMMAAMRHHPVGVMVARGDLAIEVGFERLAEVQEEILWLSEAAHIPVIWATQVLETLSRTGVPSRAEVTDAAMGVGAECVMLNKGAYVVEAVGFLDHVLHRMQAHHMKKRSMLRRLAVAQFGCAAAASS
jgi:pyruvate kinase